MSRVFAENENNDIYTGSDNKLAINEGLAAAIQASKAAVELQKGEAIYSQEKGMPNKTIVWEGTPDLKKFEFFSRKQILAVADVTGIKTFSVSQVDDVVVYETEIITIYGTGVLNGTV